MNLRILLETLTSLIFSKTCYLFQKECNLNITQHVKLFMVTYYANSKILWIGLIFSDQFRKVIIRITKVLAIIQMSCDSMHALITLLHSLFACRWIWR